MEFSVVNFLKYVKLNSSSEQDVRTQQELFNYEFENNKFDISFKQNYLKTRKWVGVCTFFMVWLWLISMLYFVLSNGMGQLAFFNHSYSFKLSDAVIITLITTTTINVVTFLTIVIKNLFPEQKIT